MNNEMSEWISINLIPYRQPLYEDIPGRYDAVDFHLFNQVNWEKSPDLKVLVFSTSNRN